MAVSLLPGLMSTLRVRGTSNGEGTALVSPIPSLLSLLSDLYPRLLHCARS